jgi:hypothetical protein
MLENLDPQEQKILLYIPENVLNFILTEFHRFSLVLVMYVTQTWARYTTQHNYTELLPA